MHATRAGFVAGSVAVASCAAAAAGATPELTVADAELPLNLRRAAAVLCIAGTIAWAVVWCLSHRSDLQRAGSAFTPEGILRRGALLCGVAAVSLLAADAAGVVISTSRLVGGTTGWHERDAVNAGLLEVLGMTIAVAIGLTATRRAGLVAACFWLLILTGWWFLLVVADGPRTVLTGLAWATSAVLGGFTLAQGLIRQRRRMSAWPDHLSRLTEGYPEWPGFRSGAVVAALAVLLLGSATLTAWTTILAAFTAAAAAFALAHRSWSPNLARLGAGLTTIAVVAIPMPWFATGPDEELAAVLPAQLNVVVFGLAWMTFHWHWLAEVWEQQRLDGEAWTTAGRLIPIARRAGFFSGVFGVLVAIQMSRWPRTFVASTTDDSVGRWVAGLAGIVALTAALMTAAVMTQKRSLIVLMIVSVMVGGLFVAVRIGLHFGQGVW